MEKLEKLERFRNCEIYSEYVRSNNRPSPRENRPHPKAPSSPRKFGNPNPHPAFRASKIFRAHPNSWVSYILWTNQRDKERKMSENQRLNEKLLAENKSLQEILKKKEKEFQIKMEKCEDEVRKKT